MKIIFFLTLSFFLFLSCAGNDKTNKSKGTNEPNIKNKSQIDEGHRSDSILFDYTLGSNKLNVEKRTDSLIQAGILGNYATTVFEDEYLGQKVKFKEEGYPFKFYVGDESTDAILSFGYYNDKLIRQRVFLYSDIALYNSLVKTYGKPSKIPYDYGYTPEGSEYISSFWNESNKAIYIQDFGGNKTLIYEDIINKTSMKQEQVKSEKAKEDSIKKYNLEKSSKIKL